MRDIIKGRKRETRRYPPQTSHPPPPPNLTIQDCSWPAAAATGGAPWDAIIGFHYAAISLK